MEKENKNKNHYFSNNPVSSLEFYSEGVEAISDMVSNKEVYNIGVIAPYGAGKSSLIKTYKDKNAVRPRKEKKKIAEVSLLHLSEQSKDLLTNNANSQVKNKDSLLEKSILEQLFFKQGKNTLPFSKIERIHNRFPTSLLLALLVVSSIIATLFAIMEYNKVFPWSDGNYFMIFIGVTALLIVATITALIISFRIGRISFQNIEIEFNKIESGSVLNMFLDEIVYYFKKTKTDVVVFEDIERFGSISLFTKLREMNHVLNNNKRINRKITFIYCVTDDFFTDEKDRAKFFEFVISLVPVLNPKNVSNHIMECLKANKLDLNQLFVKRVSRFITDKRVSNDIINDFLYFRTSLDMSQLDEEKLFAMMVYKNLCFKDYVELLEEKGVLFDLFNSDKQKIIDSFITKYKQELNDIQKSIDEVRDSTFVMKNFGDLKNIVTGIISKEGNISPTMPQNYTDVATITTFKNINVGLFVQINASILSNQYYNQQLRGPTFKYLTIDALNDKLDKPLSDLEDIVIGESLDKLTSQRKNISDQVSKISGQKLQQLLQMADEKMAKDIEKRLYENAFLLFAVKNGYIDESYYMYIGQHDSKIDSSFINSVMSDISTDPSKELKNCELIIEELDKSEFSNKYIFNYSLIETLFKDKRNADKQDTFINYLSTRDENTKKFIKDYYLSNHSFENFFVSLCMANKYALYDLINDTDISEGDSMALIRMLLNSQFNINFEELNVERIIAKTIENNHNPLENMLSVFDNAESMIGFYEKVGVTGLKYIDYNGSDNCVWKNMFSLIITNKLFEINYRNIKMVELFFFKKSEINISTLLIKNDSLSDYFRASMNDVVRCVSESITSLHEDKTIVNELLLNKDITSDTKERFIQSLAETVDYIDSLDVDVYSMLLKNNKLTKRWTNIVSVFKADSKLQSDLFDFIKRSVDSIDDKLTSKELFLFLIEKISSNGKDLFLIEQIADCSSLNIGINDIADDSICEVLILKGIIEANTDNLSNHNGKVKSLIALLIKNSNLKSSLNSISLTENELIGLLEASDVDDDCKKEALVINANIVEANIKNLKMCELIANFVEKANSPVLAANIMAIIAKAVHSQIVIDLCLKNYKGKDLISFIGSVSAETIALLTNTNGKVEVMIKTTLFDFDKYIKALLNNQIITKIKRSKNNTKINVSNLLNLIN